MKKLIVTLILATMGFGFVAVAQVYQLKEGVTYNNAFPILDKAEPVQYDGDYRVYTTSSRLNYHVSGSINRILEKNDGSLYQGNGRTNFDLAQVSFSTNEDLYLGVWTDTDNMATPERRIDMTLNITDYGIYFLDEDQNGVHTYYSTLNNGVQVEAGRAFGVYYTADTDFSDKQDANGFNQGYDREDTFGQTYTSTDNWIASFDRVDGKKDGIHTIENATWFTDNELARTRTPFFIMFQGPYTEGQPAYLEWEHFEFGFVTGENPASGQPLPGTLATLLIGGLCAKALRKRNKK